MTVVVIIIDIKLINGFLPITNFTATITVLLSRFYVINIQEMCKCVSVSVSVRLQINFSQLLKKFASTSKISRIMWYRKYASNRILYAGYNSH